VGRRPISSRLESKTTGSPCRPHARVAESLPNAKSAVRRYDHGEARCQLTGTFAGASSSHARDDATSDELQKIRLLEPTLEEG
jgi:hypothetical protein